MIWVVLAIIVFAGIAGGMVNVALQDEKIDKRSWLRAISAGLGASLLTPLFLQTMSSSLLTDIFSGKAQYDSFFVFGGFCLLAAITAKAFIQTLSDKVFKKAEEAERKAEIAAEEIREVAREVAEAAVVARIAQDAADYDFRIPGPAKGTEDFAEPDAAKGADPEDPWAGQFGGKSESKGRALRAKITSMPRRPEWRSVQLTVESTDLERPLDGYVHFYIHPTFGSNKPTVRVVDGIAELNLSCWGAFVVGAIADNGETLLELDLSKHPDATEPWRSL